MYGLQTKGLYSDFSNAISDLPHGEYLQIMARKSIEKWKEGAEMDKLWFEYLEKTHYKTGSLFSHLLAGAARCSKSQSYSVEDLISFAVNLGLSFQIADDLKDVVMTTKDQTKDSLNDLRERNTTAPYLFTLMELMRTNRQGEAKELIAILSKKEKKEADIRRVYDAVIHSDAVERTRSLIAHHYVQASLAFERMCSSSVGQENSDQLQSVLYEYSRPFIDM